MKVLEENPEVDLVSTGLVSVTNELNPIGMRWHHSNSISTKDLLYKNGCGIVHASIIGRKSWFIRNPYNLHLKIAQDYELWVRSNSNEDLNIYLLQEPLYFYREEYNVIKQKLLNAYLSFPSKTSLSGQSSNIRRAPNHEDC